MELINRFYIVTDDGERILILEYQDQIDASHMGGPATVPGVKSLFTEDGDRVTPLSDDRFRVLSVRGMVEGKRV